MTCARATVAWQTSIWTTRYANTSPHCQALPRRLEPPAPVHRRVPRRRPVRVVRRRQLSAPSRYGEQGGAHHRPRVGQAAGAGVAAEPGGVVPTLPPQLGSAGARVQPAAESDRATDASGADPPLACLVSDSLAMALYDELVRRGEISKPPQRVMQLGFPASAYEWVGSRPR